MSSCLFVIGLGPGGPADAGMARRIISASIKVAVTMVVVTIVAVTKLVVDMTACAAGWNGGAGQEAASLHDVVFAATGPSVAY